jgi:hypothetical protein
MVASAGLVSTSINYWNDPPAANTLLSNKRRIGFGFRFIPDRNRTVLKDTREEPKGGRDCCGPLRDGLRTERACTGSFPRCTKGYRAGGYTARELARCAPRRDTPGTANEDDQ